MSSINFLRSYKLSAKRLTIFLMKPMPLSSSMTLSRGSFDQKGARRLAPKASTLRALAPFKVENVIICWIASF